MSDGDKDRKSNGHGGRRANSGRKKVPASKILEVGQACEAMQRARIDELLTDKIDNAIGQQSNLKEFVQWVHEIPVEERSAWLKSRDRKQHSESVQDEIAAINAAGQDIFVRRYEVTLAEIYRAVGEQFGLTRNQVKDYWGRYRQRLRDD